MYFYVKKKFTHQLFLFCFKAIQWQSLSCCQWWLKRASRMQTRYHCLWIKKILKKEYYFSEIIILILNKGNSRTWEIIWDLTNHDYPDVLDYPCPTALKIDNTDSLDSSWIGSSFNVCFTTLAINYSRLNIIQLNASTGIKQYSLTYEIQLG